MAETCSENCIPVCDFCVHIDKFYSVAGDLKVLTGDGWCKKHSRTTPLYGECDDFRCMNLEKPKDVAP